MLKILSKQGEKAVYRFNNGWQAMGAVARPKDTRTETQILATINELLEKSPEIKKFAGDLPKMDKKYLGLVADTLELASHREMLPTAINMNHVVPQRGKSLVQALIQAFPKASKENPAALDFAQEVIDNTDTITSKYFLGNLIEIIDNPAYAKHFEVSKPLVKDIAESTLNGGYTMDYSKQKDFMDMIQTFVNPQIAPERIGLFSKLSKITDGLDGNYPLYADRFVNSTAPLNQVEDNLNVVGQVAQLAEKQGKQINLVDFVTKNVNLK